MKKLLSIFLVGVLLFSNLFNISEVHAKNKLDIYNFTKQVADKFYKSKKSNSHKVNVLKDDEDEIDIENIFSGGDGTEENPYLINTVEQLEKFAIAVNNGKLNTVGKYIKLGSNLDLSGIQMPPIGNFEHPFHGNFDGNGKTISGLTVKIDDASNEDTSTRGLFGVVGDLDGDFFDIDEDDDLVIGECCPKICNLNISECSINIGIPADYEICGSLAGVVVGAVLDNCHVISSDISYANNSGMYRYVGGLFGWGMLSEVNDCSSKTNIKILSGYAEMVGGLCGVSLADKLSRSYFCGDIKIDGNYDDDYYPPVCFVGGVIGFSFCDGEIYSCYATAVIEVICESSDISSYGGLVGTIARDSDYEGLEDLNIENCYAVTNICAELKLTNENQDEDESDEDESSYIPTQNFVSGLVGVIVGNKKVRIKNCYSSSNIDPINFDQDTTTFSAFSSICNSRPFLPEVEFVNCTFDVTRTPNYDPIVYMNFGEDGNFHEMENNYGEICKLTTKEMCSGKAKDILGDAFVSRFDDHYCELKCFASSTNSLIADDSERSTAIE
jgi:hypothetical protein